jgi:hypothetical protein
MDMVITHGAITAITVVGIHITERNYYSGRPYYGHRYYNKYHKRYYYRY